MDVSGAANTELNRKLLTFQEKVKELITNAAAGAPLAGKGKSGKGGKAEVESGGAASLVNGTNIREFRTEYAKSGGSKCGICEDKIPKGAVRIGKKEYDSTRAKMYGPYDR